jgi:thiol-disulfide isomerase/thioredoxin
VKAKTYYAFVFLLLALCFWSLHAETNTLENKNLKTYREYSKEAVIASEAEFTLLYFHASWCPTCHFLEEDILNNLKKMPENLTIFKVDFDKAEELKISYDVTVQTSMVLLDKNGVLIKKWLGSRSMQDILEQVKSATNSND